VLILRIDTFDHDLEQYQEAYEARKHSYRKWVEARYAEGRFDSGVRKELLSYWRRRKFGEGLIAGSLSGVAAQAISLAERDLGTDNQWGLGAAHLLGPNGSKFQEAIGKLMKDDEMEGPGYVGEEDVEDWIYERDP